MATATDDRLGLLAYRIIEKFGDDATFNETPGTGYVPGTGENPQGTLRTWTRKLAPPWAVSHFWRPDNVELGDAVSVVARWRPPTDVEAVLFDPKPNYRVTWQSVKYIINRVEPLWSGQLIAAWMLYMRK
jgi:hypothetical protein